MLNINVRSFSYKEGIPEDPSGNGGGFTFDCRGILNPGRIEVYKTQTGRDKGVQEFLESKTKMPDFLNNIHKLLEISIQNYLERDFSNLEVNFGCTGGQHRSVYACDKTAEFIRNKFPETNVTIQHLVQERKKWINETY